VQESLECRQLAGGERARAASGEIPDRAGAAPSVPHVLVPL